MVAGLSSGLWSVLTLFGLFSSQDQAIHEQSTSSAGSRLVSHFPPDDTKNLSSSFPTADVVGYPGNTSQGAEAFLINDAPAFALPRMHYTNPLVSPKPTDSGVDTDFKPIRHWANLSPWRSLKSLGGLHKTSPHVPTGCALERVHLLHRHGSRQPTSDAPPAQFAEKIASAAKSVQGFKATGDLAFLHDWQYKLGSESLSRHGAQMMFNLGVEFRLQYGSLLNNYSHWNTLPVLRTESQNRMHESTLNFAAGFFGLPLRPDVDYHESIMIENKGFNASLSPYYGCPNSMNGTNSKLGNEASADFVKRYATPLAAEFNEMLEGLQLNATDVNAMQFMCAYDTIVLGWSPFCSLFTAQDWRNFEYAIDLSLYYNSAFGGPYSAALGKGYLEEFWSRLSGHRITQSASSINTTLTGNPDTFPIEKQSIFIDATHEVVLAEVLTALNMTALAGNLPIDHVDKHRKWQSSKLLSMGTHLVFQELACSAESNAGKEDRYVRAILNDAVLPWGIVGCEEQQDGLCARDTLIKGLEARIQEIDFSVCFRDTPEIKPGDVTNGRFL
ncbi:uncharacterized protein L969DRAFT_521560 [Mixia osmundae IAM 14324]|uniref:3-phytase n=1 Tax=Mixia osmundae (strain CBS 9802 / IAM 14324 / JCM 22182 / KY 12970) TaxID=764103 RepID=G7DZ63_MIXOS|nr:uncharacterized protein L969DRAFT_521560 [Mixia osmundae IAM 14324]KEI38274.1 hypothetical protein L969DRAFT_521560 [Mixia osmundae IAM 14324]GAA95873.1 hypothetical protein E5Q_02530 [Mixia osmundae IAM 14324]